MKHLLLSGIAAVVAFPAIAQTMQYVPRPPAMQMENVPQVPLSLAEATRPYLEYRTANFMGWNAKDGSMLIGTRFGNTSQLHRVANAGGARTQISFEEEPVSGSWSPTGDMLIATKDKGGDEFYQLYRLQDGRLTLLTDGKSRNTFNAWSKDGQLMAYSSTRRNGTDSDLYIMDPRDPATNRMVAQVTGGGWAVTAFTPDKVKAVVGQYVSATKTNLWLLDLASGQMTPIGDHKKDVAYGAVKIGSDGRVWALSDEGSDYRGSARSTSRPVSSRPVAPR